MVPPSKIKIPPFLLSDFKKKRNRPSKQFLTMTEKEENPETKTLVNFLNFLSLILMILNAWCEPCWIPTFAVYVYFHFRVDLTDLGWDLLPVVGCGATCGASVFHSTAIISVFHSYAAICSLLEKARSLSRYQTAVHVWHTGPS